MIDFDFVTNPSRGLGDCLSCFNTNRAVWSPSPHYPVLRKYSSIRSLDEPQGTYVSVPQLQVADLGAMHVFNRVRHVSGLEPLSAPRAMLDHIRWEPLENNVAFSFDVGGIAAAQRRFHPRARQLYDEHRATIQSFLTRHKSTTNFVEVGVSSSHFQDAIDRTSIGLEQTIQVLRKCRYYFGMHSGMMHLATAIGIPALIIVNFPAPELVQDPMLAARSDIALYLKGELQWLYPQHIHLHEDATQGDMQITRENLEQLFDLSPVL